MFVKRNSIIDVLHAYMDENSIEENNKSPNIVECIENVVKYKFGNNYDNLKQYNKQTNHDFADALALLLDSFESLGGSNTEEAFNIYIPNKIASFKYSQKGITYDAGTVLMTNNGSRSPVVQMNDGKTYSVISSNFHFGSSEADRWNGIISVSYEPISYGNLLDNLPGAHGTYLTEDGKTFYGRLSSTNRTWGGGTEYTNPQNLPEVDYPFTYINSMPDKKTLLALAKHLDDEYSRQIEIILQNKDGIPLSNVFIDIEIE